MSAAPPSPPFPPRFSSHADLGHSRQSDVQLIQHSVLHPGASRRNKGRIIAVRDAIGRLDREVASLHLSESLGVKEVVELSALFDLIRRMKHTIAGLENLHEEVVQQNKKLKKRHLQLYSDACFRSRKFFWSIETSEHVLKSGSLLPMPASLRAAIDHGLQLGNYELLRIEVRRFVRKVLCSMENGLTETRVHAAYGFENLFAAFHELQEDSAQLAAATEQKLRLQQGIKDTLRWLVHSCAQLSQALGIVELNGEFLLSLIPERSLNARVAEFGGQLMPVESKSAGEKSSVFTDAVLKDLRKMQERRKLLTIIGTTKFECDDSRLMAHFEQRRDLGQRLDD